jgi:hypothetical protein
MERKAPGPYGFSFLRQGSGAPHQRDRGVHSRIALTLASHPRKSLTGCTGVPTLTSQMVNQAAEKFDIDIAPFTLTESYSTVN